VWSASATDAFRLVANDRRNAQFEVFSGLDRAFHCITFLFNFDRHRAKLAAASGG
jgi:hypothetical protein